MPLTEGGVQPPVAAEEHLSALAGACVSCDGAVIEALHVSITLGHQLFIQGFVFQLGKEDRGEVGRQMAISLAKESCVIDFP